MRIGIARIWQETNTFSPKKTTLKDYKQNGLFFGKEVLDHLNQLQELSGAARVANSYVPNVELVPLMAAMAWPGGLITKATLEYLRNNLFDSLNQAGSLDGLFVSMHGALSGEGYDDAEGELLTLARERVGYRLPISVSLDMHANITNAMIKSKALFVGYHTCPHLDVEETGGHGMKMLLDTATSKTDPKSAFRKIPMVVPADRHSHLKGPLSELIEEVEKIEKLPEVISASIFPVQPWLDVKELGWTSVVITNGYKELARELADKLADECWRRRNQFWVKKMSPKEAVRDAMKTKGNPVVISDSADSTNSGATGNSTWLLKELLDANVRETVFMTMVDPDAAQKAYQAGIGAGIDVEFGKIPANPFTQPLKLSVRVKSLHNGKIKMSGHLGKNLIIEMGKTGVLEAGNIKIITSEFAGPGHVPPEFLKQLGLDVKDAKIIVVKSPVGFRDSYEPIAAGIILCESPGPACSNLTSLDYKNIPKPLYPFEPDIKWSIRKRQKAAR